MHIISKKKLRDFWERHPKAKAPLLAWYKAMKVNKFISFAEVCASFPAADYVRPYTVFDIGGNNFRMLTTIHYNRSKVYVRELFTHKEYDRWSKKQ